MLEPSRIPAARREPRPPIFCPGPQRGWSGCPDGAIGGRIESRITRKKHGLHGEKIRRERPWHFKGRTPRSALTVCRAGRRDNAQGCGCPGLKSWAAVPRPLERGAGEERGETAIRDVKAGRKGFPHPDPLPEGEGIVQRPYSGSYHETRAERVLHWVKRLRVKIRKKGQAAACPCELNFIHIRIHDPSFRGRITLSRLSSVWVTGSIL